MIIQYNNQEIEMNDEWSFQNFTNRDADIPDGTVVYASCFLQEKLDAHPFLDGMRGVTFYACNLDNCVIPEGNTVIDGSHRRYISRADGDWLVDKFNNIISPLN